MDDDLSDREWMFWPDDKKQELLRRLQGVPPMERPPERDDPSQEDVCRALTSILVDVLNAPDDLPNKRLLAFSLCAASALVRFEDTWIDRSCIRDAAECWLSTAVYDVARWQFDGVDDPDGASRLMQIVALTGLRPADSFWDFPEGSTNEI